MRAARKARWHNIVFVARYAHQPFPVVLALTVQDFSDVLEAITAILNREEASARG